METITTVQHKVADDDDVTAPAIPHSVAVPRSVEQALEQILYEREQQPEKTNQPQQEDTSLISQQLPVFGIQIPGAMMLKNPKTTFAGLAGALPLLVTGVTFFISGNVAEGITKILEAVGIILVGYFAKDAGGTSEPSLP